MDTFDLAAEKALVVTLVTDPLALDYVAARVRPAMFGSELAREVLTAVEGLVKLHRPITPVTVQAAMVQSGRNGSVIPVGWHTSGSVSAGEAVVLADRIRELHARRELTRVAAMVAADAVERPAAESVARLGAVLDQVQTAGPTGARQIGDLVMDWVESRERDAKSPLGDRTTFATGFRTLDRLTGGLRVGQLAVLAARPGNGKTALLVAMASNLAAAGVPVGIFWLEDEAADAARRFLACRLAADASILNGPAELAVRHVASLPGYPSSLELPIFIDDTHGLTITDIAARMRRMKRDHGVRVFMLDHLGEVRVEREERWADRHDLALGRIARIYRDTAKDLDAVPVLVSQMNRQVERREAGGPARMSDLDGSGQVEQAARLIAFLKLDRNGKGESTGMGGLEVAKCVGRGPGVINLRWDMKCRTWEEA
jgi:replicative DNA helicase